MFNKGKSKGKVITVL